MSSQIENVEKDKNGEQETGYKSVFCPFPYVHVAVNTNGMYRVCCEATEESPHSLQEMKPAEWLNSQYMQQIRQTMEAGQWPSQCSNCKVQEAAGVTSKRLRTHILKVPDTDQPEVTSLDWRIGRLCNAACANCNQENSTKWERSGTELNDLGLLRDKEISAVAVEEGEQPFTVTELSKLKRAYIAGGEPFLLKSTLPIVESLPSDCEVIINTNLSILNDDILREYIRFGKHASLVVSIDGTGPGFNLMRHPIKFEDFDKNLRQVMDMLPQTMIVFNFTWSLLNVSELAPVIRYFRGFRESREKMLIDFHPLEIPNYLKFANLDLDFRKRVAEKTRSDLAGSNTFLTKLGLHTEIENLIHLLETEQMTKPETQREALIYLNWLAKDRPYTEDYISSSQLRDGLLSSHQPTRTESKGIDHNHMKDNTSS
ncbi:MAG: radical SAM protein [Bdellovibrionales bacterium]|nr:radical SAM protein [Bdellovibrionales bacterium]